MTTTLPDGVHAVIDFVDDTNAPQRVVFTRPESLIVAYHLSEVLPALRAALTASQKGHWVIGYLTYESASAFDPSFITHPPTSPLLWFATFKSPQPLSPDSPSFASERGGQGVSDSPSLIPRASTQGRTGEGEGGWENSPSPTLWGRGLRVGGRPLAPWQSDLTLPTYTRHLAALQDAIAAGETYQVNYTRRLTLLTSPTTPPADIFAFYERLRADTPYASYIDTGDHQILSASPELFFQLRGSEITARPMKGTAARGRWLAEDDARADALRNSEKERAENVMIVDLLRNDLGRIAEPGSVRVPNLFEIERYPTVLQMTSTIQARLRPGLDLVDIFSALFPCGSITGAPKVQTMRHIAAHETGPRGVYCGAIGFLPPGGESATFAVAIRTAVRDKATGTITYGVGGGITADSNPISEWNETEAKSAILHRAAQPPEPPFDLLETLLLRNGAYYLLDRHLSRLTDSARFFGRPHGANAARQALEDFAAAHPAGEWRVRLLVDPTGSATVTGASLTPLPSTPQPVCLAGFPVSRDDITLFHKTTRRAVYDRARAAMPPGIFDILLMNHEGEATEFTFGNLIVEDTDGARWTPPQTAGLLAGTLRAELIATGQIHERTITIEEIRRDTFRLYFANSVRGIIPVELRDSAKARIPRALSDSPSTRPRGEGAGG